MPGVGGWPSAIKSVAELLKKFWNSALAFFLGRATVKRDLEKQRNRETQKELENELEAGHILRDRDAVQRMRDAYTRDE